MGHSYSKTLFAVYLKFKFNWAFCIFIVKSDNPTFNTSTPTSVPTSSLFPVCGFPSAVASPQPFLRLTDSSTASGRIVRDTHSVFLLHLHFSVGAEEA